MARADKIVSTQYGIGWTAKYDPLERVFYCIRNGGRWTEKGVVVGAPIFDLYRDAFALCWPNEDFHRWVALILQSILDHRFTVVMGPKSTGKTRTASKWALIDYWLYPEDTCFLISSTESRGAELRIWGDIKTLFAEAKDRFPWLAGNPLESKKCIATDKLGEDCLMRDLRKGMILIPCKNSAGRYVGLGMFAGIKNKRMRLLGDEVSFMPPAYLDVPSNLDANPDFKGCLLGNPLDPTDALGRAGEPMDGWSSVGEPKTTTTWKNRFLNGITVNLVGTDSPNNDPPATISPRYPYLMHKGMIASTVAFYGQDSQQYWSQCVGIMKVGMLARRVITAQMCREHHALEDCDWQGGDKHVKIYAIDAAYGNIGGDRCIGGWIKFGRAIGGMVKIWVNKPKLIPVVIGKGSPEDTIAAFVKEDCAKEDIPPENVFFDSTGRGSLGTAFARIWSNQVNPIEFGGPATERPVSDGWFLWDPKEKRRRLKRCNEQYANFVTELWYSVRYAIEGDQMANLPEDVMTEGCRREWGEVRGHLIQIELKEDMKERTGQSPDLFDWLATGVEGARRRGFGIAKMGTEEATEKDLSWLDKLRERQAALRKSSNLVPTH